MPDFDVSRQTVELAAKHLNETDNNNDTAYYDGSRDAQ